MRLINLPGFISFALFVGAFWLISVALLAHAYGEWRYWNTFRHNALGWPLVWPIIVTWLAVIPLIISAKGAAILSRILSGQTSTRLAKRDLLEFAAGLIMFAKTGFWGK